MLKAILDLLRRLFITRDIYEVPKVEPTVKITLDGKPSLEGKPLRYLIGTDTYPADPLSIIEVSYDCNTSGDNRIAYCNLFDEKNTGKYGPYLHNSDTAEQYNEGQIDPNGSGWERNLREQFQRRMEAGFHYVELDNPDAYATTHVLQAIQLAGSFGLKVIAKNPGICDDPVSYVTHANIAGIIVEKDCGSPEEMERLRREAGKPALPVWFVSFGSGRNWADHIAVDARRYNNMGVTYSTLGEYGNSIDILKPNV